MSYKILGIGNALVDIIALLKDDQLINNLQLPKGSMTLVDGEMSDRIKNGLINEKCIVATGGSVANAINAIAHLSVPCGFLGKIGHDEYGELFESDLKKHGAEPLFSYSTFPTGRAVGLVGPDGERTFATFLGAAAGMTPEDVAPEKLAGYNLFFIEGYLVFNHSLIKAAAQTAKSLGMTIALDLASFNVVEANRELLNNLVDEYVDIIFANEEEAKSFTGKDPLSAVQEMAGRCRIAVVKIGREGAYVQQGDDRWHIPAAGHEVIDTTGAGDFFAAGFLAGLAKGYPLDKCGRLGALLAAEVIRIPGAKLQSDTWTSIREKESTL